MMRRYDVVAFSAPILNQVMKLQDPKSASQLSLDYGESFSALLEQFKQHCVLAGVQAALVSDAVYALVALIDESILHSAWPGKEAWSHHLLQVMLFSERLGGVHFFHKIESLKGMSDCPVEILELYHACLCVGFQGQYRFEHSENLKSFRRSLHDFILREYGIRYE